MNDAAALRQRLLQYAHNPAAIRREVIRGLDATYNGEPPALNPLNPVNYLLEVLSVVGSAQMDQSESLTHQQYPSSAKTYADLYRHMSDKDYIGRFATPAVAPGLRILIGKEELIQRAVAVGTTGIRKLVIPRHSSFTVGGIVYTLQYPIELRVMAHGGIQVVYDGSVPSPVQTLESNQVEWVISDYNVDRLEYLVLRVPVMQFSIASFRETLTPSTSFRKSYSLTDQYYHARAFTRRLNEWVEIKTTHSDQVFDPLTPTVVLQVLESELQVKVPQIYQTSQLLQGDLRIDIYTTRGPVEQSLGAYDPSQYGFRWEDLDNGLDVYSAPLSSMTTLAVYGEGQVSGGSFGLSFEQLRERVMLNALARTELPITNAQMDAHLQDMGYDLLRNIDVITNRQFVATRSLPVPTEVDVAFGAGAMVGRVAFTLDSLSEYPSVIDNGNRLTLTPDTLFREDNGLVSIVSASERAGLDAMPLDRLADAVSQHDYLYTPFHYVLDTTNNSFNTRPYYFGDPQITGKSFVDENGSIGMQINSAAHRLERRSDGWVLKVLTSSGDPYKALPDDEVFVQLMIRPIGEVRPAYVNGVQIGRHPDTNERIFEFPIRTQWDVTDSHRLITTSFAMFDTQTGDFAVDLSTEMEILYGVMDPLAPGQSTSQIDVELGHHLLPSGVVGVYQERLQVSLGQNLQRLWVRARSTVTDLDYVRHAATVYETYEQDVYERDAQGLKVYIVDGSPQFNKLHSAGDPRLDAQGNPIVRYAAGTPVLDENGLPTLQSGRRVRREADFVLFDGVYYFATAAADMRYRDSIPQLISGWLDGLATAESRLLEQTRLYFRPRTTMGLVDVIVGEGVNSRIRAEQDLTISLYVRQSVYRDNALRQALSRSVRNTVSMLLGKTVVTTTEIISTLRATLGEDVIAVEMTSVGNQSNRTAITLTDPSTRLSVGKRLMAMPDGTLSVQDRLNIGFVRHVQG